MPVEMVCLVFLGFVALAKANQVWRHNPMTCRQEDRDHLAKQVAPGRVTVQAQPGQRRVVRTFVQVVQAQARHAGQVADEMRFPGVPRQVRKALIRRAYGVLAQR